MACIKPIDGFDVPIYSYLQEDRVRKQMADKKMPGNLLQTFKTNVAEKPKRAGEHGQGIKFIKNTPFIGYRAEEPDLPIPLEYEMKLSGVGNHKETRIFGYVIPADGDGQRAAVIVFCVFTPDSHISGGRKVFSYSPVRITQ